MPGTYYMPGVNLIHRGALNDVGTWAQNLGGTRGLIVASMGSYGEEQGKMVAEVLAKSGIQSIVYAGAGPNPTDVMVMNGVELYKDQHCDLLVAIGGGSAIDCAKGIGLIISNGGTIEQYEGADRVSRSLPPFITVNTTAGTGSEVTSVAVLTDSRTHHKMTIVDWRLTADVSVNDPQLMVTMPPALTAATGMDALSHAIEAYVATNATALTDALAYEAIVLVFQWLPAAFEHGEDVAARYGMCNAAFLAGLAFNNSGLGYVHALSHPLTGKYGLPHGVLNAVLLPAVMRWNAVLAGTRMAKIAVAMGAGHPWRTDRENAEKAVTGVEDMNRRLKMPSGLAAMGVRESDIPALAEEAMEELVGKTNPRQVASVEQMRRLYLDSM
ncbi:MAG: L-threonine dehydrogenase [Coprothermobacter sp.]|nr:L-threonine dehydrogenase [Coprothermobacter sp.]